MPELPDVEVSPVRKDDTDSMLAARRALDIGGERLMFFGCLGGKRLDHTLANIQALAWCAGRGAEAYLVGEGCCLAALPGGRSLSFDERYRGDFSVFCSARTPRASRSAGSSYSLEDAALTARFPPRREQFLHRRGGVRLRPARDAHNLLAGRPLAPHALDGLSEVEYADKPPPLAPQGVLEHVPRAAGRLT